MGRRDPGGKQLIIWTHKADMGYFRTRENVPSTALARTSPANFGVCPKRGRDPGKTLAPTAPLLE